MIDALHVTWQSLRGFWEEFVFLIVLNVVWSLAFLLITVPLFALGGTDPILALALSLLLSWPLPIVSGALCFVANQIARDKAVGWETFGVGLRRYWAKSLAVALINLVVLILIVANAQFYAFVLEGTWTILALIVWLMVSIYWLVAQIYWFPMILELENEKVLVGLRSALAMVMVSPGFSLTLVVILTLLTVLCIALTVPAVLAMASLILLIANHATRSRLALVQRKRQSWEKEEGEGR